MSVLTIQPSNIDTFLQSNIPDDNFGNETFLNIDQTGGSTKRRPMLKLDFSALPAGAILSSALFGLYYYAYIYNNPVGNIYWAYELTQTGWVELEATWNNYKAGSAWTTAGGDFTTDNGASLVVPASYGWMNWNVLAAVQHFQSAHGKVAHFLLKGPETNGAIAQFYSSEYTVDPSLCPKLVLTYTVHYVLSAGAGSYTKTGQSTSLRSARRMAVSPDSYLLTGVSINLNLWGPTITPRALLATIYTITPTGNCTFNVFGGIPGKRLSFIITTSGTISRTLTFNINFKSAGTLSTGTVSGKVFQVVFNCKAGPPNTLWVEESRTGGM